MVSWRGDLCCGFEVLGFAELPFRGGSLEYLVSDFEVLEFGVREFEF